MEKQEALPNAMIIGIVVGKSNFYKFLKKI